VPKLIDRRRRSSTNSRVPRIDHRRRNGRRGIMDPGLKALKPGCKDVRLRDGRDSRCGQPDGSCGAQGGPARRRDRCEHHGDLSAESGAEITTRMAIRKGRAVW